jgi:tRNA(Ile)-lysidine synthase
MANTRKWKKSDVISHVARQLSAHLKSRSKLVLGLSGGLDSVALLDVLHSLKADLDFDLSALHINHQISPHSNEWAEFCRELCAARKIPLEVEKIEVLRKGNLEAAARVLRYQAFSRQNVDFVVLAQHLDDQAETVLLRLLRGAGAQGLSGMPIVREMVSGRREAGGGSPQILRPLLDIPRREILGYVRAQKLNWVEDESNLDTSFDRNFLRREILPAIDKRFPAYRRTIARAADNLANAAELSDELARIDANNCIADGAIMIAELKHLAPARVNNLLRFFLRERGLLMPDRKRLEEARQQLLHSRQDAQARIVFGDFELRRHRARIHLVKSAPSEDWQIGWRGEDQIVLPQLGGTVRFRRATGAGISMARLDNVTVRNRRGGERIRPDCKRPSRSLKNLLQEHEIPPWERQLLPLLFNGEALVWVPGIGITCNYQAHADEMGLVPEWLNGNVRRF